MTSNDVRQRIGLVVIWDGGGVTGTIEGVDGRSTEGAGLYSLFRYFVTLTEKAKPRLWLHYICSIHLSAYNKWSHNSHLYS